MVRLVTINNPHNPQDGLEVRDVEECSLSQAGADYIEQPYLAIAFIKGKRYFPTRDEWGEVELSDGDVVYFMPHVGGVVTAIIIAVVAIAAIAVALLTAVQPPNVANTPEPDPVFDLKGQKNQIRLGQPIEDPYGRVRLWPSYATRAYNQYYGNDQFQFQLFCLGHGSYDVEEIRIEDTPIGNFQEVEYEITEPFGTVGLFPDNVETSVEVNNIELYGPNEDEYVGNEFAGPFVANAVNTETNRIEVDVILPNGLYYSADDGSLDPRTVQALFEYQALDENGVGVGPWLFLPAFVKTLETNTPQRFTIFANVPAGRYQVRASRTNDKDESHRAGNKILWGAMRAFLPSTGTYGDVTMLAVKARATNNLNDQSSNRVNVIATRKLPIHNGTSIPALDDVESRVATRSPIWAMVNILRSTYGGKLQEQYIDFDHLVTEAATAETNSIYFDWIYDQRSTVWEALKLPCFVNKSIPMANGSRITTIRDTNQSLPTFFVSNDITEENSFTLSKKLYDLNPNDGLEVEYTDPDTWKSEVVKCLLPNEAGNNPKRIKVQGVTDRQRAYDLGMYSWAKESYERTSLELTIGLEGYIPAYGDLVRVQSDVPRWGINGEVLDINGTTLTLDQDVEINGEFKIALRGKEGQDLGTYNITEGAAKNIVETSAPIPVGDIPLNNDEGPFFIIGEPNLTGRICRIVNIEPTDSETVKLSLVVNDARRFADYGDAPALNDPLLPPSLPDAPVVTGLEAVLRPDTTRFITVSWEPALGANSYILESSTDNGNTWVQEGNFTSTNTTLQVNGAGELYLRVAGVGAVGIGPFDTWNGQVGVPTGVPANVTNLRVEPPFTGSSATVRWDTVGTASSYILRIFTGGVERASHELNTTSYIYSIDEAIAHGNVNREVTFTVTGKNTLGESETPASVTSTNPVPPQLAGFTSSVFNETDEYIDIQVAWGRSTESDISFYRVWADDEQGFTPAPANVVFEGLINSGVVRITKDANGKYPNFYWRAAAIDMWGDESNIGPEQTVEGTTLNMIDDESNTLVDDNGDELTI